MRRQMQLGLLALVFGLLAACQPQTNVLPTVMSLDTISTNDAATANVQAANVAATAAAVGATATADAVTQTAVAIAHKPSPLPPTWTPSPPPTEAPPQGPLPTDVNAFAPGTIYYIFNGDSIAALKADSSSEKLILVGSAPAELTLSPDGKLLAYSAQGNGSARELFITTLDGTYVQQVSCLGFSRVTAPAWSPDSQTLAFAASQSLHGELGIYTAGVIGSGQCPAGNNQRLLTQTNLNDATDMTWNNDASQLFFSSKAVYGYDMVNNLFFPPITTATGYGPDFGSAYRPGSDELYYLKSFYDSLTKRLGGTLYHIHTTGISTFPIPGLAGASLSALQIHWSHEGRHMLSVSERDIYVLDVEGGSATPLVTGSNFFPQGIYSPDDGWVAYVDGQPGALTVQQIFVISADGQTRQQISFHKEGTIANLNWGA